MAAVNLIRKRDWFKDIFLLTIFTSLLYFLWLGSYPIFSPDEGRYSEVAREMLAAKDFVTPRVNGIAFLDKPILHYWLQVSAMMIFGINEWAIRFFPALTGILGALITYICGRQLFNRQTGILSAIILATSPLYFAGAHYANMDLEVSVFISASLLFFLTGTECKSPKNLYYFLLAYSFAALAFLTKGMIALAFPALIVGCWMILLSRYSLLKRIYLPLGLLLFFIIVAPWYFFIQKVNPGYLHYFFITQQITRFLSAAEFNSKQPFWFFLPAVLVGLFPWTIFLFQAIYQSIFQIWQNAKSKSIELFLLLWLVIVFTFFSIPHSKITTYILPIFPCLALLIGNYLTQVWEKGSKAALCGYLAIFMVASTLLVLIAAKLPSFFATDFSPNFFLYFFLISLTFLIAAISSMAFINQKTLCKFFSICTISSVVVLLTLCFSASYLNKKSTKPLTVDLKTILKPDDQVASYFKYYYDLPVYLNRRISIVADWEASTIINKDNWVREFWFGKDYQKSNELLITENQFWDKWHSNQRMFVFLNEKSFRHFKELADHYYFLGKSHDILLFSNQITRLTKKFDAFQFLAKLDSFENP